MKRAKNSSGVYFRPGKRGGSWWVDYVAPDGRRIRQKVEANNKDEAKRLRSVLIADALRGELRLPGRKRTLLYHDLCDRFVEHAKVNNKSWQSDVYHLKRAREHFGNVPVERITRADCEAYKNAITKHYHTRAWSLAAEGKQVRGEEPAFRPATANHFIEIMKRVFFWAEDVGLVDKSPAAKVRLHKNPRRAYYLLSREEEQVLLDQAARSKSGILVPVIKFALHTGARREEILGLEWERVDFDTETVTFTNTKNGHDRHVPMTETVVKMLRELRGRSTGRYVFDDGNGRVGSLRTAWLTARRKAKLSERLRFHDLRHTAASRMVMAGVPLHTVGEILGNPSAVSRYAHLEKEHTRRAIRVLDEVPSCHNYDTNAEIKPVGKIANL